MKRALLRAFEEIAEVGQKGAVSAIGRAFDLMEVAEQEIARAGGRKGNAVWEAWLELGFLVEHGEELYRLHCRELIRRAKDACCACDDCMRPATKAEVLAFLSNASLKAPPARDPAALQARLFCELFPDSVVARETEDHMKVGSSPGKETQEPAKGRRRTAV